MITEKEFASMVDHSYLKAFASETELGRICDEAKEYGFKSVAINSVPVKFCADRLKGSSVLTGAAISFPLGQTCIEIKAAEAQKAADDGAQEFDYVLNVGKVKEHNWKYIEEEMRTMVDVARRNKMCCKVIFETCYLTDDEIAKCADIASVVKPDFVKTSTGFGTAGAKPEHVALMKQHCGKDVQVKAAGGIRTLKDVQAMVDAGATRIGCSAGIAIINEIRTLSK